MGYKELAEMLRCSGTDNCAGCRYHHEEQVEQDLFSVHCIAGEAADAIEGLLAACDNYEDALRDAVDELCERDWISVTDRLPECGEDVLCYCRASICEVMKLQTGGTWECDGVVYMSEFVTHWMKLPEPPTEVEA